MTTKEAKKLDDGNKRRWMASNVSAQMKIGEIIRYCETLRNNLENDYNVLTQNTEHVKRDETTVASARESDMILTVLCGIRETLYGLNDDLR